MTGRLVLPDQLTAWVDADPLPVDQPRAVLLTQRLQVHAKSASMLRSPLAGWG
ncbi:MAG: hypothetical protein ACK5N0_00535 [Synechococcaceae cyanobacterium]